MERIHPKSVCEVRGEKGVSVGSHDHHHQQQHTANPFDVYSALQQRARSSSTVPSASGTALFGQKDYVKPPSTLPLPTQAEVTEIDAIKARKRVAVDENQQQTVQQQQNPNMTPSPDPTPDWFNDKPPATTTYNCQLTSHPPSPSTHVGGAQHRGNAVETLVAPFYAGASGSKGGSNSFDKGVFDSNNNDNRALISSGGNGGSSPTTKDASDFWGVKLAHVGHGGGWSGQGEGGGEGKAKEEGGKDSLD